MKRLLAIDYGTKRCGIAVTDILQISVNPLSVVHPTELLSFLEAYIAKEPVELLIIGEPIRTDGSQGKIEPEIVGFIRKFQKQFPLIPIERQNEQGTSKMAVQTMIATGVKKKARAQKSAVDKVSAVLILQTYLGRI
mgnify:CR=1 FL=1